MFGDVLCEVCGRLATEVVGGELGRFGRGVCGAGGKTLLAWHNKGLEHVQKPTCPYLHETNENWHSNNKPIKLIKTNLDENL